MGITMPVELKYRKKFERDLEKFADDLEVDVMTVIRKVVLSILEGVTKRTPVDTGIARASWQVSINTERQSMVDIERTYTPDQATQIVRRKYYKTSRLKPGDQVLIYNNIPYIVYLEYGSSDQAPNGMLRVTVQEAKQKLDRLMKGIK